ncbi:Hypothetical predicted protein, partial [Prunus dulcis]
MGNQVSSSPAPTPSHYYQGDRYGAPVVATNMESHGAPQKLQRPYNDSVISSDEAVRIYDHVSNMENRGAPQKQQRPYNNHVINSDEAVRIYDHVPNMENSGAPQKQQRPYNNHVINSDEAVRIYGGICVTTRTNKPAPVINRDM